MIIGVGVDVCDIARFAESLRRTPQLGEKLFTDAERGRTDASLAARLEENPDDAEGWARLVRSYMVLGRPDDARDALARARAAFFSAPEKRAVVEAAAREAGLDEGTE